ncbi:MAG: hypothetical protein RSB52_09065, partial [Acidaminococcaceae bacterium]
MNYPIDAERFATVAEKELGKSDFGRKMLLTVIPVVNDCYMGGKCGIPGYPFDAATELAKFGEARGKPVESEASIRMIGYAIEWCNRA